MSCGGGTIFREEIDLPAGEQSDALVFAWPTYSPSQNGPELLSVFLSVAQGTDLDWTLFFAPAGGAAQVDVAVVDSATVSVAAPAPNASGDVANRRAQCSQLVPFDATTGAPMPLRVTTSGKTGAGRLRIAWRWADGM